MKFTKILYVNQDIFINPTYSESFMKCKDSLEEEIERILEKTISDNNQKCDNFCNKNLRDNYKEVK